MNAPALLLAAALTSSASSVLFVGTAETYRFTEPGWIVGDYAQITGQYGSFGSPVALVLNHSGIDGSHGLHPLFPAEVGVPYAVSVWVNADKVGDETPLWILVYTDEADLFFVWQRVPHTYAGAGWSRVDIGFFVNIGYSPGSFHVGALVFPASNNFNRWVVGRIEFEPVVAP